MFALKLATSRPDNSERKDAAALLNEESRLELQEAQLAGHLAELGRREELAQRTIEDRRVQMSTLSRQGANGLSTARLEGLVSNPADAVPTRETERALAARAAAVEARRLALETEKRRADQREALLATAEQTLVGIDRDLERERGVLATRAEDARRLEQERAEQERARRQAQPEQPALPSPEKSQPAALQGAERRQHHRTALETHVDLCSDSNFYQGFSSDLSDGGIFVATCCALPAGSHVDLLFSLPTGASITARGVVRWSREFNEASPDVFPGLGVEFVEMSDEHRRAIREFTAQRDPLFWCE
ncbi:MAG: TIGR02266 family protein [Myxococcales bacterium]